MTYLRGGGPRFVTVYDRGGVKFVKSGVCILYGQPLISKDYCYINAISILMFIVQQILVVSFKFTGAARGFMIMSCAAREVKKVGQHCVRPSNNGFPFVSRSSFFKSFILTCRD